MQPYLENSNDYDNIQDSNQQSLTKDCKDTRIKVFLHVLID